MLKVLNLVLILFLGNGQCQSLYSTNRNYPVCADCSYYYDTGCRVGTNHIVSDSTTVVEKLKPNERQDPRIADCFLDGYKIVGDLQNASYVCSLSKSKGCGTVVPAAVGHNPLKVPPYCKGCGQTCGCEVHKPDEDYFELYE